jgi:hypothetical protein
VLILDCRLVGLRRVSLVLSLWSYAPNRQSEISNRKWNSRISSSFSRMIGATGIWGFMAVRSAKRHASIAGPSRGSILKLHGQPSGLFAELHRGDDGHLPTFGTSSNWFEYVHAVRSAANNNVSYSVEAATNLVSNSWTTNGFEFVGSGILDIEFNTASNRIPTVIEGKQFIRLLID